MQILEVAALSIGKPVSIFDKMLPDDMINVLQAVLEENLDFFTQKIEPQMRALMASIEKAAEKQATSTSSTS
jgi:Mg/Co/Ni transporter MgtE